MSFAAPVPNCGIFNNLELCGVQKEGNVVPPRALGRMGLFAAMMTYLVAATLLVGGMVTAAALFFAKPSGESVVAEKPRAPLVRAADRQAAEALKAPAPSKAAPSPQSAGGAPTASAINRPAAPAPQAKAAEPAQRLASQLARKKKGAKPAPAPSSSPPSPPSPPPEEEGATLGYSPSEKPRKFVFPFDPDW